MTVFKSLFLIGLAVLALAWLWSLDDGAPATPVPQPTEDLAQQEQFDLLLSRIDTLENDLAEERALRQLQDTRIAELEQRHETMQQDSLPDPQTQSSAKKARQRPESRYRQAEPLQQRLVTAGVAEDVALSLQMRIDQNRLALLQLRDQAIRENWFDSKAYNEQASHLRNDERGLRADFGDDVYDRYLYAAGRPNRVVVKEVYTDSSAAAAGIQPGDIIISYALRRIFSMSALQQATSQGLAGESVLVDLLRNGQTISTSVPRGPLGISMTIVRRKP